MPENEELTIAIENTPELTKAVDTLSEYLRGLELDTTINNRLVALTTDVYNESRINGFSQGFDMGIKTMKELRGD